MPVNPTAPLLPASDDTSSERVLAFATYYWSVLDEHPPSACRDGKRSRCALISAIR